MKLVLQRVKKGSVAIDGKIKGSIGCGFVALVGFGPNDDSSVLSPMADKMLNLRVFEDDAGSGAAEPGLASRLYDEFNAITAAKGVNVQTGEFGAEMLVEIHNDGPVTIILDSDTDLAKTK